MLTRTQLKLHLVPTAVHRMSDSLGGTCDAAWAVGFPCSWGPSQAGGACFGGPVCPPKKYNTSEFQTGGFTCIHKSS